MLKEPPPSPVVQRHVHIRNFSTPNPASSERQPLIRRRSFDEYDTNTEDEAATPLAGGTVLGIHNLAIVMPQFIVRISGTVSIRHNFTLVPGGSGDKYNLRNRGWNW